LLSFSLLTLINRALFGGFVIETTDIPNNADIVRPPGARLLFLADFLFSAKTVDQTFKPLVADWRFEYFEALKGGQKLKARWISIRYLHSFVMAASFSRLLQFLKQLRSVTK